MSLYGFLVAKLDLFFHKLYEKQHHFFVVISEFVVYMQEGCEFSAINSMLSQVCGYLSGVID